MSNSANKTYYDVLQVKPSATPEEITATYRKLARHYHPDHNDAPDATRVMQIINEAYDVLNDPQKREAYERFLKEGVPMDRGHRTTQIFMHVLRQGAPVGLFRKMSIIFDGRNIGQISWSKQRNFIISPGKHTIYVKMDSAHSKVVQFQCEVGERIGVVCGANSALGTVVASVFTPKDVYYIKVMKL